MKPLALLLLLPALAAAQERAPADFDEDIEVQGHYSANGAAASSGSYGQSLIEDRPRLRPGEIEELVPGLIVTQHSGAGKANQFFLRGFNLDHGADFATSLNGVPLNLPSHAHGQGYIDLNGVIPELVGHVEYFKGPYFAAKGDFASAGAADLFYVDSIPHPRLEVSGGNFGYYRALAMASAELFGGSLLVALEAAHEDGPWVHPDDYHKYDGILRYTHALGDGLVSVMAQGYAGEWNATDQIPERASIGRFDAVDSSDGGISHRYSLSAHYDSEWLRMNAYAAHYDLDLFSDFTFFLDDPSNGDQVEQSEQRWYEGFNGALVREISLAGIASRLEAGWDGRIDHVAPDGLFHTRARGRLGTFSLDDVTQASGALYGQLEASLRPWLRLTAGLRATEYDFSVRGLNPHNGGSQTSGFLLPKATLAFGPWSRTELFFDFGEDYHSNDARGVFATVNARSERPPLGPRLCEPLLPLFRCARARPERLGALHGFGAVQRAGFLPRELESDRRRRVVQRLRCASAGHRVLLFVTAPR